MISKDVRSFLPYAPPVMPEARRELLLGPPPGDDQAKDKGTADPGAIRSGPLDDKKKEGLSAGKPDTKPGIGSGRQGLSGRARLFDPGVTASIAEKDISASLKESDGITFSTKQYRFKGYMDKLRSRIEGIWVYPREAIEKGIYGDLELRFTINRDGTLKGRPELVRTSGYRMLDEAAIKALKEGEPYWPLPEEWGMDTYTIKGHFIYGLYGRQLR